MEDMNLLVSSNNLQVHQRGKDTADIKKIRSLKPASMINTAVRLVIHSYQAEDSFVIAMRAVGYCYDPLFENWDSKRCSPVDKSNCSKRLIWELLCRQGRLQEVIQQPAKYPYGRSAAQ